MKNWWIRIPIDLPDQQKEDITITRKAFSPNNYQDQVSIEFKTDNPNATLRGTVKVPNCVQEVEVLIMNGQRCIRKYYLTEPIESQWRGYCKVNDTPLF